MIVMLFCFGSCSRSYLKTYSIEGKISDIGEGFYVELYETDKNVDILKSVDSIINGNFMLTDTISAQRKINLYLKGKNIISEIPIGVWVAPDINAYISGYSDTIDR